MAFLFLFLFLAISAAGAASRSGTLSAGNAILSLLVLVWDIASSSCCSGSVEVFRVMESLEIISNKWEGCCHDSQWIGYSLKDVVTANVRHKATFKKKKKTYQAVWQASCGECGTCCTRGAIQRLIKTTGIHRAIDGRVDTLSGVAVVLISCKGSGRWWLRIQGKAGHVWGGGWECIGGH